ncbi:type 1 glutamine amidotransferase domain-containing protein [Psychrobium sp. 1_MG-2023]|uniref:type 1 glutamine amidotransferase domain-containing protein n=1 Tax=Psychrobium sp. 1_MG-2023 TaxID=3062624 RepID=UPI000C31ECD4|nr:type 1 glutamine amidotransferase domain-containing protein [Psychrobium sp. 1_MG-2023]MDP2561912.1 type 1 glutamine amidotransferase domain-containing protein [Psychrobium sp. 1_MG-2023]PKF59674.1 type 1 glutamine amidotransferase domain-containing protein [Alteromonadales bacterium alter-6D02]
MKYIKQTLTKLMSLLVLITLSSQVAASVTDKKVLMVLSGYGQQQGEEKPGYEFDEFSKAYTVFNTNGIRVDIASPQGGKVEADKFDAKKPFNAKVLANKAIMTKLNNTLSIRNLEAKAYDAIFIVGGKGAMFDLPKDTALQSLIADIYQQQGTVAAVCHGPAALVDVTLNDGSYLVANKAVNGFTNQEENLFGKKWISQFDFMLQDKLIERGAKFQSSEIMLSHVAVDERLITGQNPASTVGVATALVKALGLTPIANELDKDDHTLAIIAQFLAGDKSAITTLANHTEQYHLPLVGTYGFYYLKIAETDIQLENALALMTVAQKAINNPVLDLKIAKTQHHLGHKLAAKATLNELLASKPDYKPALDMLKTISL